MPVVIIRCEKPELKLSLADALEALGIQVEVSLSSRLLNESQAEALVRALDGGEALSLDGGEALSLEEGDAVRESSSALREAENVVYILQIEKEAKLVCPAEVLAIYLRDSIELGGFDTLHLDNFASVARLYRHQKQGLKTYAITSQTHGPPFSRRSTKVKSETSVSQRSKRCKETSNGSLAAIGLVVTLVIVIGGAAWVVSSRRKASSKG